MDRITLKYSENLSMPTLLCGPCGVVMEGTGITKLHGSHGHESRGYKCRPCGKVATTGAKLKWHKISVHESF